MSAALALLAVVLVSTANALPAINSLNATAYLGRWYQVRAVSVWAFYFVLSSSQTVRSGFTPRQLVLDVRQRARRHYLCPRPLLRNRRLRVSWLCFYSGLDSVLPHADDH